MLNDGDQPPIFVHFFGDFPEFLWMSLIINELNEK